MEMLDIVLSDQKFDEAVHGPPDGQPSLPEASDLAIYVKKRALTSGRAAAVLTFEVMLPNGKKRRVQKVATVTNLITVLSVLKGWREGGHLEEPAGS